MINRNQSQKVLSEQTHPTAATCLQSQLSPSIWLGGYLRAQRAVMISNLFTWNVLFQLSCLITLNGWCNLLQDGACRRYANLWSDLCKISGQRFVDSNVKLVLLIENFYSSIKISLKFIHKGSNWHHHDHVNHGWDNGLALTAQRDTMQLWCHYYVKNDVVTSFWRDNDICVVCSLGGDNFNESLLTAYYDIIWCHKASMS